MVDESGLLDSKMSAIEIRAELERKRDFYLVPLAKVGGVPALYEQCLASIVSGSQPATLMIMSAKPELIAAGYETNRSQTTTPASGDTFTWQDVS